MARTNVVKSMPINLSAIPPQCEHCILGKQARTPVPKTREGAKATRRLERVFVDLCGPMSVTSQSGHLYAMNIIDDFSSYVWTIPLRAKSDAADALQVWHRLVENQCGERLKIFVTDNGELLSNAMVAWCGEHGIEHLLTAPYTSAHNGRVERLHRTLLDKVRTMRLACNAPTSLWDEFCATAAYLTSLTATSSLNGKTPFELWFGHSPSLSHLREIGCRAFALVLTHNPKLLQRSVPCVLIGYAPHAKAYRLWNPATGRVFNSYHVTFVEHLDTLPADLLPGTLVNVDDGGLPPSWDAIASTPTTPSFNSALPPSDFINPVPSTINNPSNVSSTTISNSSMQLPTSPELSHGTITTPPNLPTNLPNMSTSIPNSLVPSLPIPSELTFDPSFVLPPSIPATPPSPPCAPASPPRAYDPAPPPLTPQSCAFLP